MSTIEVEQAHSLPVDVARGAVEAFGTDLSKWKMKLHWSGNKAELKGPGASGSVAVTDSAVKVTVKLGMMARMAVDGDRLKGSITRRLKAALEAAQT